jgi:hypothetical protein
MDNSVHAVKHEVQRALRKLESEVREGLEHGFFDLSVSCEVIAGGKRRLTIRSGKSHQFIIPQPDVRSAGR